MKRIALIGFCCLLLAACLREKYGPDDCRAELFFEMKDVPYAFVGDEIIGSRPYYVFTEQLDLLLFSDDGISDSFQYDYEYCRRHPVIPVTTAVRPAEGLFIANLYDPKALDWTFSGKRLIARLSILDYEEPPVYLAALSALPAEKETVPVQLLMLVSRLEIEITNPPAWVTGLNVTVRNIAATVATDFTFGDTTHISKQIGFDNQGPGEYRFGVNTFPTYQDQAALLNIDLVGISQASPILVNDERLHLLAGVVTRLRIEFADEQKITVAVEIDGKWEVVDEGNIII